MLNAPTRPIARALLLGLLLASASFAAPQLRWRTASPSGGPVTSLLASTDGSVLYASAESRVFRSVDGGVSWQDRSANRFEPDGVYALAVDPHDSNTVWAAGFSADVFRSRDGGATWAESGSLPSGVFQFAFDTQDTERIYAATRAGLFLSTSGGAHWDPLTVGAEASPYVSSVVVDPRAPNVVFAAVWENHESAGRVWRSDDRGATWKPTPQVRKGNAPAGLVFDPARPGTLYLLTDNLAYRTIDSGASWQVLTRQLHGFSLILPSPTGRLFGVGSIPRGVARSDDGGATWTPSTASLKPSAAPYDAMFGLVRRAGNDDSLLGAGEQGLWRSQAGGRTWSASSNGIHASIAHALDVDADGTLLASFSFGAMATRDGGEHWKRITPSPALQPHGETLIPDRSRQGTLYAFGSRLRSLDGGRNWAPMLLPGVLPQNYPYNTAFAGFVADESSPGTLYTLGWTGVHSDISSFFLQSHDYGETWTTVDFPPFNDYAFASAIAVDGHSGAVYVSVEGQGGGLYRSDDGGRRWIKVGAGLPAPMNGLQTTTILATDRAHEGVVYAVVDGKVFGSTNRGASFSDQSVGLPAGDLRALEIEPGGMRRLFAALVNQGVFVWQPAAGRWQPLNAGLPTIAGRYGEHFPGVLALDADRGWLFTSTYRGIQRLDLGSH
ncbi:MAG: hypothetical protein ABI609_14995 [Acidobacteriota bacterium]